MRIAKFLLLCLALPLMSFAQQPSAISDPQPMPAAPMRPVTPTRPVTVPRSQQQEPNVSAPAMPAQNRVLLRRIAAVEIPGRPGFKSVAIVDGNLVMAHPATATLDVFSLAKRRLIAQVKDMKGASGVAVDPRDGKVYVANADANEIAVIGVKDWQVVQHIPLKTSPSALLLVPEENALYASNWRDQSISRIDLNRAANVNTMIVDGRPEDLVSNPSTKEIYATLEDRKEVIVLDPALRIVKRWPLQVSQPTGMALDARNRRLYVAVRYAVLALDADSGRELNRVAAAAGIDTLWLDSANNTLYGIATGGSVLVMKTSGRLNVEREFPTDIRGHSLAFDSSKSLLYIPGGRDGRSKLLILRHVRGDLVSSPEVAKK